MDLKSPYLRTSRLRPRSLSSSATTSRRIYFRQASSQTDFSCDLAILFPRHQDLISVGMPHTRSQIRDGHGR
ncbi:hypothetical protein DFP72DRAFT_1081169 [Ephemerocybe angulata]|uniref:Uncharacterized protein n=1 Tax=Ephemerocybe angulata TaxID=980116 RepID=A0A8H6HAF0_9AGAR|nr:hypothetical protein DFP72DRAFT_1081169 [Tulosesus angulatus]